MSVAVLRLYRISKAIYVNDEPIRNDQEDHPEYNTDDPEVPFLEHHLAASINAKSHEDANTRTHRYVHITTKSATAIRRWTWRGLKRIWTDVLWNRSFWSFAATVVMAVSTAIYSHYAAKQWKVANDSLVEIRKQFPEIQKSANAATRAAKATEDAVGETRRSVDVAVEADRPWVGSEGIEITENPNRPYFKASIRIGNSGKTPARITFVSFAGHVYTAFPNNPDYPPSQNPWNARSRSILVPNKWSTVWPDVTVDSADVSDVENGKKKVFFYGIVQYEDMRTGKPHVTKMCWYYNGSGGAVCPEYNDAN